MGTDKPRYLVRLKGRYYWRPTPRMKAAGFADQSLGANEVYAKQAAILLNAQWDKHRFGERAEPGVMVYPPGSLGAAYNRTIALREAERRAKGIIWTRQQKARDDWPRAWRWIGPAFGDYDPLAVVSEDLLTLRTKVAKRVSESEAFRVIKVWRALWAKLPGFGYRVSLDSDPSLAFANSAPPPRQEVWPHHDVLRLVQRAWREGYHGLAALLAVAWDTMLSPVDVRTLTIGQRLNDGRAPTSTSPAPRPAAPPPERSRPGPRRSSMPISPSSASSCTPRRRSSGRAAERPLRRVGGPGRPAPIQATGWASTSGRSARSYSAPMTSGRSRTCAVRARSKPCAAMRSRRSCRQRWPTR